jgi:HPt (histidine-containing phosphotransfer) domain-containing protein
VRPPDVRPSLERTVALWFLLVAARSRELRQAIAQPTLTATEAPSIGEEPPQMTLEFDREQALATVGGDEQFLGEVIAMFLDDCPRLLDEIGRAIEGSDAPTLRRLAHTVRGVAGNFATPGVVEAAKVLELHGMAEEWDRIPPAFEDLWRAIDRIRPALDLVVTGAH